MNILHVTNSSYGEISHYGARSRYIIEQSDESNNFWVCSRDIAADADRNRGNLVLQKIPVHPLQQLKRIGSKVMGSRKGVLKALGKGFDLSLLSHLKRINPERLDVLHTWEYVPHTIAYLKKRYPHIAIVRDIVIARKYDYFNGTFVGAENSITDYFLSPSEYTTECLMEWGISGSKIIQIPFGVDTELFTPDSQSHNGKVRFAFSGGISFRKGCDTLLDAWNTLQLENAELHLYGSLKKEMEEAVAASRNVICHGHIQLDKELPLNDVFVFPSILEGSAKSVYEALSCGLPVISTREAGPVFSDGAEGFIIESGDTTGLAEKMKVLYENEDLRMKMSTKARAIAELYTWKSYTRKILESYQQASSS